MSASISPSPSRRLGEPHHAGRLRHGPRQCRDPARHALGLDDRRPARAAAAARRLCSRAAPPGCCSSPAIAAPAAARPLSAAERSRLLEALPRPMRRASTIRDRHRRRHRGLGARPGRQRRHALIVLTPEPTAFVDAYAMVKALSVQPRHRRLRDRRQHGRRRRRRPQAVRPVSTRSSAASSTSSSTYAGAIPADNVRARGGAAEALRRRGLSGRAGRAAFARARAADGHAAPPFAEPEQRFFAEVGHGAH